MLWALDGFGIMMRSMWDIHAHVARGQLVPVLEDWELPSADVYAVYLERATVPAKVTAFIDFLVEWFGREAAWVAPVSGQLRSE